MARKPRKPVKPSHRPYRIAAERQKAIAEIKVWRDAMMTRCPACKICGRPTAHLVVWIPRESPETASIAVAYGLCAWHKENESSRDWAEELIRREHGGEPAFNPESN